MSFSGITSVEQVANLARIASRRLALATTEQKNLGLHRVADEILLQTELILQANARDCDDAHGSMAKGSLSQSLFSRLVLDKSKLIAMAEQVRAVAQLPDPVGKSLATTILDDKLVLTKLSCPIGVLAVIFESRPDAMTQIGSLAIKSANAVIMKGGSEATRTNQALLNVFRSALAQSAAIPSDSIQLLTQREEINEILALDQLIDLVIPRGSSALVRHIQNHTKIPVMGHSEGICHVYLDESAQLELAIPIVIDSKIQYSAACNAAETLLVHQAAAPRLLRQVLSSLIEADVELHVCPRTRALLPELNLIAATDEDWDTEHSGPVLSVKVVDSLDQAVDHINTHGSGHTDTIVTSSDTEAERFTAAVDSAGVFINASTRFADGFRYGFGAEVGISTGKLHARGPVGLDGLSTYKYILRGNGQIVASYSGKNPRKFAHEKR